MNDAPLVSIVVVTYNSEKYILETLESAKNQTYSPIELIVSDDCSSDSTCELVEQFIRENKAQFSSCQLIQTKENTGISGNCNRGIQASNGEWIKIIAGDDVLVETCIEDNINFTKTNSTIQVVVSSNICFNNDNRLKNYTKIKNYKNNFFYYKSLSPRKQFLYFLFDYAINSPTIFFNRFKINEFGGYDENAKKIDDVIFYMRILLNNINFHYLDAVTVLYREHSQSVSKTSNKIIEETRKQERLYRYEQYIKNEIGFLLKQIYKLHFKLNLSTSKTAKIFVKMNKLFIQRLIKLNFIR